MERSSLRPERMPGKDIEQLADIRLSGRSAEKDHIAAELKIFAFGFPAGICYALDLMANGEKWIPGRRSLQTEGTSGLWTVWEKLSDKAFYGKRNEYFKSPLRAGKNRRNTAKRTLGIPWLGIPEVLKGRGVLLYDQEREVLSVSGMFRIITRCR